MNPEIRFDRLDEQERARSRRMNLILALGLGPSLILGLLGYYDAAITAVFCSLGAGLLLLYLMKRLDEELVPLLEMFYTGRQRLVLFAALLLYLGHKLVRIDWKQLFSFF